jgi:hypothetical protein
MIAVPASPLVPPDSMRDVVALRLPHLERVSA